MQKFLNELYQRNVVRATSAYLAFSWLLIQIAHLVDHALGLFGVTQRWVMILLCIGLIPMFTYSWRYEITGEGIREENQFVPPKRVHHRVARKLDRVTVTLLLLAFSLTVIDQFGIEPMNPPAASVSED